MLNQLLLPSVLGFFLLLTGMKMIEFSLRKWAGNRLSTWIARFTATPVRSFIVGTVSSAFLQSSSVVTVLTIGFVNAGWLTFGNSLGIILGINVGTCVSTEFMSLNIYHLSPFLFLTSLIGWTITLVAIEYKNSLTPSSKWLTTRYISLVLAGFAFLLFAFKYLQNVGIAIREQGYFAQLLQDTFGHLLWGVVCGTIITAMIHSSAAVVAMCMGLANANAINLDVGIAIILGANVGTCFTGLVASLGGGSGGKFVAVAQLILNAAGALIFFPFIHGLSYAVTLLAPDNAALQIAHAQLIFNLICSFIALPLAYLPMWHRKKLS